ncbi:flavin reductase family protein [Nocardioides anomalus]|uniref:flavin reductase family protein n=1 Tax=Nocardioides anomalus TaxID=2712223 RepID=UPI0018AD3C26|nr:flavin reductase [Nocardioides anomalus]
MTIHRTHPFADAEPDPARRLRGRLGGAVTLWTTGSGVDRAGLTVTSLLVALGDPPRVLGLVDPDSDLALAVEETGTAVVQLLAWPDRDLAEAFAGTAPAPGGLFRQAEFTDTGWGPRLAHAATWAGVRLEQGRDVGWSRELTCVVEHVEVGPDTEPLAHRRGRWMRP